ncbi:HmuY family protein [Tamlana sp. 2201CG12-4]|uniref:HmuY family protein n=1 Tax=Tamlana sp. 2201CG12-4 TaxID=3112582 RepID=UPI002DB76679|nr:HmuY family protein [Tamlana sp. 2201CG12-4]MEC3906168.1 HmuY family protein [Tamlana sp. 2201CG12-4]
MKTIKLLTLLTIFIGFMSCDNDDSPIPGNDTILFEGSFSRDFEVQSMTQRATYTISQSKINYDLAGGVAQTNYDTAKEYFSTDDMRWVGYRESKTTYYVIFFKNITENTISLYKKEVKSLEAGKSEPVPDANNTENHGWNTYIKHLPISGKIENLHAPQSSDYTTNPPSVSGEFTKFDFASGQTTTSDTDWDIAFRGTSIIVNGGESLGTTDEPSRNGDAAAYILNSTFDEAKNVIVENFVQDSSSGYAIPTGSGNGWYNYAGPPTHLIAPIAGKILVFKTRDNKYAKIEILSYYKDADTSGDSRYYTFNYVYQPNDGVTSF